MINDGTIDLATGMGVRSKVWKNDSWLWSNLVKLLQEENKTNETYKKFKSVSREERTKIKDVGGYVGGYLKKGRRTPKTNVIHRQLLTLDIDFAHSYFWDDFHLQFNNAAVLHSTHSHTEENPKYRLIMPLSRKCSPDEYEAVARKIAGELGIELFDATTFEISRLMFWPSVSKDMEYYCKVQDSPWVDVDEILALYTDWTDSSLWPTSNKQFKEVKEATGKQEDPETKKGIIGAFCRTHNIIDVLENILNDVYTPANDGRYTYIGGTTASGLITYDDKFAYSHHGTDPCSGKLCNAFDLVRIHKFGHLDSDSLQEGNTKSKSFKAMEDFARTDPGVRKTIASENFDEAKYDFAEPLEEPESIDWASELEVDFKGKYISSAANVNVIFANDLRLKELFRKNNFDGKKYIFGSLPWRKITNPEIFKDSDYSGIRNYVESVYGISGNTKIEDALVLQFVKHSFHPVKEYLKNLKWDGIKRIDDLLIDYFGADDNIYSKEAIRKTLIGAVGRVFEPGIKFDLVLSLVGEQGIGKSTFFKKLGKQWFSDTLTTVKGKEALEQIQGKWIIEMAELSAISKAEVEIVKNFISKQEDTFRHAYGRVSETYYRQCIFVATTNKGSFLRDPSGNRRFMPIDVNKTKINKDVLFSVELDDDVDQIWAEAVELYKKGENLYLSREAELIAYREQRNHSETDERKGLIEQYLDTKLPSDWDDMDIFDRRDWIRSPVNGFDERDYTCVAEIWCECLGKEKEDMSRYNTRDLNDILESLEDWERSNRTRTFKIYGVQKYYLRNLY